MNLSLPRFGILNKIRRSPKLEGWAFANFGSSSGIEEEPSQKRGKKVNAVTTGNQTRDLSITDQMSALTNQVHLKIQFRHRFDQKCPFTDSFHRLASRFARTLYDVCSTRKNFQFIYISTNSLCWIWKGFYSLHLLHSIFCHHMGQKVAGFSTWMFRLALSLNR